MMLLRDLFPGHPFSPEAGGTAVRQITADSREVRPGALFAALPGTRVDGRRFIASAVERGASAVLSAPLDGDHPPLAVAHVKVPDPRLALAKAAARFHPHGISHIAAVTGTNGKSSTVAFLRQIWAAEGLKAASMGTLGAMGPGGAIEVGHTTPDPVTVHQTLAALSEQGVTHLALEASSHGLEQRRIDGVALSSGAFTNLTQDHLDYHPDMDSYRAAKLRLFSELLPEGAPAIVNADSPEASAFEAAARGHGLALMSVGWRGRDLKIEELMPRATGQRLFLRFGEQRLQADLPLIGEFQALNALAAAGLAIAGGLDAEKVLGHLSALRPVRGRMDQVGETAGGAGVFVDYAHTPDGLDTALRAARPHTAGKLVVVFGAGGDRDPGKRPLMGAAAIKQADRVIVTDDNPRSEDPAAIRAAVLEGAPDAQETGDRAKAIREAVAMLEPGDTLLIAGKGHETGQIVGEDTLPFSDHAVAREALGLPPEDDTGSGAP